MKLNEINFNYVWANASFSLNSESRIFEINRRHSNLSYILSTESSLGKIININIYFNNIYIILASIQCIS